MTCRPEKQSIDPCVFQQRCRSVIRLSIQPPRVHLAVGVPAAKDPQDTIEHAHLRDPEKRVRIWVDEEIASDGNWRKKQLTAKEKNMRCQLQCQAIGVPRAGRGRPGYTKALGKCRRRKKEIGPKTVKLCRCGQMLHVQTNGASAAKWQDGKDVACADKCCRC